MSKKIEVAMRYEMVVDDTAALQAVKILEAWIDGGFPGTRKVIVKKGNWGIPFIVLERDGERVMPKEWGPDWNAKPKTEEGERKT